MSPHPLTKRANGVYSRDNLPKKKNWAYVVNLGEYESVGFHWKVCI